MLLIYEALPLGQAAITPFRTKVASSQVPNQAVNLQVPTRVSFTSIRSMSAQTVF